MDPNLESFTDVLSDPDEIDDSQPLSLTVSQNIVFETINSNKRDDDKPITKPRPTKRTGQYGQFRSIEEIDEKYRNVFSYQFFNLVQSSVLDDALYTDKSIVVSAPTGSGKTVVFEMAIVQLLMEIEDNHGTDNFKIIYMAPVKALCTERLTEWYPKFTKLGLFCIEVTGDTDVDFTQLAPYRIIITTPEKWDMLTRRWRDYGQLVEQTKLFLIDEVHILNDPARGPVLEAVVSRMKTIESSAQSAHRIEQLRKQYNGEGTSNETPPKIRFVAVSATVGNPEDVASWLGNTDRPAVYYTFGDESRPVKLRRVVEGYSCPEGCSIFKFDIILNYKLWPIIQKYHNGKPTLIFCNTRKSVALTAETLSREITIKFSPEQKAKLEALASTFKNKKLQCLVMSGVGCHHAGLLYEERTNIEHAFRNSDLPILITTTTLAMGVNLPAHLVIVKNTQQYVNGAYQEYSISTVLQMVGRAGRPQFDTEATAVIMTRHTDKGRYQALVGGSEPLQSYLHKRLAENLNSEAALGTVGDVAQCVQWLRSTFLFVRAARDPKRYLGLPQAAPQNQISKKIEELCVKAMNGLASSGLITMDEASCIESTEAGRLMSIYYLDLETMKHIMKINGTETLEQLLWIVCESHELSDMHLRVDERRYLNALNRNNAAATIRFPMKGKITTKQMKVNCLIQATLGCLPISEPSLNQEAMRTMRIADRVCKCLIAFVTQSSLIITNPKYYSAVLNSAILAKCVISHLWENSQYVSKQLKGIGATFSMLLATAGKVNFMSLEESHPRDLERILNKGPPVGNVLRKQISLLPKYQLTITPIDEKSVTIQLDLLNLHYLMENIDNLTAGSTHKSCIIVGDSENHILLLRSFNDKSLISVYNGTITFEISRIHSFEHKIFAHCISSTFAGIDVHYDYLFKDLEPLCHTVNYTPRRRIQKQTTITNTFKERKRQCTDSDVTQPKEKKKRDSNLVTKFQDLRESFSKTSKTIKDGLERPATVCNKILENDKHCYERDVSNDVSYLEPIELVGEQPVQNNDNNNFCDISFGGISASIDYCNDKFDEMNDDNINDILSEIENEMVNGSTSIPNHSRHQSDSSSITTTHLKTQTTTIASNKLQFKRPITTQLNKKGTKKIPIKANNYNFIDLLERNIDLNDEEETEKSNVQQSGFTVNIKGYIDKYLNQVQKQNKVANKEFTELIDVTKDKTNYGTISKCTDNSNSKLPKYVELHKETTLPSLIENNAVNQHPRSIEDNMVITTSRPNEKLEYQYTCTDHSKLPEYVELNKKINIPTIMEQDKITRNIPSNENTFDEIRKVSTASEPNKQFETQKTIKKCANTSNFQKSNNDKDNDNVLIQNEKSYLSYNTEITVTETGTMNEPLKQNESPTNTEINYANQQLKAQDTLEKHADITKMYLQRSNNEKYNVSSNYQQIPKTKTATGSNSIKEHLTQNESPTYTEIKLANSCNFANDVLCVANVSYENVDSQISNLDNETIPMKIHIKDKEILEHDDVYDNFDFTTNISKNGNRIVKCFEDNKINTMDLQLFNPDPIPFNEDLNIKPDEKDKYPIVSQLINKTKSLTLENNHQIVPLPAEENTHYQVCIDNVTCNKTARNINNSYADPVNTNHREYTNRYVYTSGQTNVTTKITNDSIVRITRKLHVNLDITEVLQKDTIIKVNDDSHITVPNKKVKQNKLAINDLPVITLNKFAGDHYLNKTTPQQDFDVKFESSDLTTRSNVDITCPGLGENVEEVFTKHSVLISNAITDTTAKQDFEHEFKDKLFIESKNENTSETNVVSNLAEENSQITNDNKNINSILNKYSKILGNRTIAEVNNQNAIQNIKYRPNKPQRIQKRPFKITEINKFNSQLQNIETNPLPLNINEHKVTITKLQNPKTKKVLEFLSQNKCDLNSEQVNETPVLTKDVIKEPNYYQPFEDLKIINDNSQEIDIDSIMFNPKTLLQRYSYDDGYVAQDVTLLPPPPEFSDINNSPKLDSKEIELPTEFYDPKDWNDDSDFVKKSNIFQNDFDVDLTPTKEIEAWTLSQDNENKETAFGYQASSYTVLNENYFNDSHYSTINDRHTRLSKFVCPRKKKLQP